ncbi:C-type mannose receptor 2-like isoform X1 [Gadus chalcogrammus]|uniref:C-type mannose receptor 2-like isoform X1 n=2 Tax=Gadus chalcogrammus TaxID=1042646 RepID=UPI0024C354F8|nr:C-type mannose receptor 2-like isoform X1 [Gadus chalcogrammus]
MFFCYRMQETILLFCLSGLFLGHHALPPIKSYYYVDQKLSWTDAQQHCRDLKGDLATVDNVVDLQHLNESRTGFNYDDDFMWIGLYDDRTRWKWSLGDQDYKIGQNYGTWTGGDPDFRRNEENCTVMFNTGKGLTGVWADTSCSEQRGAVCFDDEEPHYIALPKRMTWYDAMQSCRSNYTDLASVRNISESYNVSALIPEQAWIGLHRYPWSLWSDGSSATFLNWGPGEPNSSRGPIAPRCVKMSVNSGHFFDEECGLLYNFACQGNLKQRSTFKIKISSEADMMDPEVGRQILEQLHAKLAEVGVTGSNISWVLEDGQVFHKDQPSKT